MHRREVFKTICKFGLCSCASLAMSTAKDANAESQPQPPEMDKGLIDFMQKRLENLLSIVGTSLKEKNRDKVLKNLGRHCGSEVVKRFEGDPEGFWKWGKTQWIKTVDYDKNKGIIHISEKKRKTCNCPLAKMIKVPSFMCICSIGAQEAIYEKLFNVPVKVKLEESVLTEGKRCRFTVFLRPKAIKPPEESR